MTDKKNSVEEPKTTEAPLVFISHDSRDAELAEIFSKLLKSVSAGMLKSFRSSDKKGTEGIEFGDEWYKTLMGKLDTASDVVCLLTERSLDRPWILYEAGVAKGKLGTPVYGIALGIPLSKVSTGPFYQFQNSDDSEEALSKLILQLCRRVPGLDPDESVIKNQVQGFKTALSKTLKSIGESKKSEKDETLNEGTVAKVLEEMKVIVRELPIRLEQRIGEGSERNRSRKFRRFHPMMVDEMASMISRHTNDPIGILVIASLVREDFPWLYEIGVDVYRTVKSGNIQKIHEAFKTFQVAAEFTLRGPFMEEMGINKESYMLMRELPMVMDHYMHRILSRPHKKKERSEKISEVDDL